MPQKNALLILGVQRTGTALLAKDIGSLGFLSTPGEHFLKIESGKLSAQDRNARFAALGTRPGSSVFAVTLMINYLHRFAKWLDPKVPEGLNDLALQLWLEDRALRFFLDGFDTTTVVTLHRAALWEVAYSTWRVSVTNQYHAVGADIRHGDRTVKWRPGDAIPLDPAAILLCLTPIIRNYRKIDALLARHNINPVRLSYDEVVDQFPAYLRRVMEPAGHGEKDETIARRQMTKLVDPDELDRARRAMTAYLGL